MRVSNLLLILGCLLMLAVSAQAQVIITPQASAWSSQGVATKQGDTRNYLLPQRPQAVSEERQVIWGRAVNVGSAATAELFANKPVQLKFILSDGPVMHQVQVNGIVKGRVGIGVCSAYVQFTSIKDVTTGSFGSVQTNPMTGVSALYLPTAVGGVYMDARQNLYLPGEPMNLTGYLQVP